MQNEYFRTSYQHLLTTNFLVCPLVLVSKFKFRWAVLSSCLFVIPMPSRTRYQQFTTITSLLAHCTLASDVQVYPYSQVYPTSPVPIVGLRGTAVERQSLAQRSFAILRSTCSQRVTTYVGKPSAIGQPARPTQPFWVDK